MIGDGLAIRNRPERRGRGVRTFSLWMRCWYVDASDPTRCDPVSTQVAFCEVCGDFVHAEQFVTAAECERIIQRERMLDEEGGEALKMRELLYGTHEQFAELLRIEAMRMRGRASPPRCLTCGSGAISVERRDRFFEAGCMPHNDFSEGLRVRWVGFADSELEVDESDRYYDRDGNKLRRDR